MNFKNRYSTDPSYDSTEPSSIVDFLYGNGYLGTYIIRVCSYNVNCRFDKNEMYDKWLNAGSVADIMAIGFQELYFNLKDILAPESIFQEKIDVPSHKKWVEFFQSLNFIRDNYNLLLSKSFAGLCLIIYLRKPKSKLDGLRISNLLVGCVPVGMLGMANKGALAISFRIGELTVCFINCHLPAGGENCEKRQFSMQAVIQKLQLIQYNKSRAKKINFMEADIDVVFLFGDLNFRLQKISAASVINELNQDSNKATQQLLQWDELIILKENDVLYRSFHEGQIEFQPTYKFLLNSNKYETKRVPSFCDRILWTGNTCLNISYRSFPEFTFSDHKPISADFLIDLRRLKKRKSNMFDANNCPPQIRIESTVIEFGDVYFMKHNTCETKITNMGKTTGEISFKNIETYNEMPTWFTIIPSIFSLEPKESRSVQFRIYIDSKHVSLFNRDILKMNCQFICVSIVNGIDTPLTFKGVYHVNIFGIHLELLKFLDRTIETYQPKDIRNLESSRKMSMNPVTTNRLLERILSTLMPRIPFNQSITDIILHETSNSSEIMALVNKVNDLIISNPNAPTKSTTLFSINAHVEVLLIYLKSLPQPIIPFFIQTRLATSVNDRHHVLKILHNLPRANIEFLRKVVSFFHEFLEKPDDTSVIASLLVSCIPPSNPSLKEPLIIVMSALINHPRIL